MNPIIAGTTIAAAARSRGSGMRRQALRTGRCAYATAPAAAATFGHRLCERERRGRAAVHAEPERVPFGEHPRLRVASRVPEVLRPRRAERRAEAPADDRVGREPHVQAQLPPAAVHPHVLADREPLRIAAGRFDRAAPERDGARARHEAPGVDLRRVEREVHRRQARLEEPIGDRDVEAHRHVGARFDRLQDPFEPARVEHAVGVGHRDHVVRRGRQRHVPAAGDVGVSLLDHGERVARCAPQQLGRPVRRAAVDHDHLVRLPCLRGHRADELLDVRRGVLHGRDQRDLHDDAPVTCR